MARKVKIGLDYFPHACSLDDELEYIIAVHKELGYYVYFRLLERIYKNLGYYINWDKKNIALFSNSINVDINKINDIINDCLSEHLFDKSLHKEHNIITSKGIQERYFEAIERRKEAEIIKDYILLKDVYINSLNVNINWLNVDKSTQSKVKESKEEKIKVIDEIYLSYPSKCPVNNSSTGKSKKDKEKIEKMLSNISKDDLLFTINTYIAECKSSNRYMKNFSTFLNNLPDYEKPKEIKPINDGIKRYSVRYNGFPDVYNHSEKEIENFCNSNQTSVRVKS